jgi:hypothetical protein
LIQGRLAAEIVGRKVLEFYSGTLGAMGKSNAAIESGGRVGMRLSLSPWIFIAAGALGFSGAFLALGYGWPVAVIAAAAGAILGFRASRRLVFPPGLNDPNGPPHAPGSIRVGDADYLDERREENNGSQLSRVTRPLKAYQKFAFLAFLAQATICFILIAPYRLPNLIVCKIFICNLWLNQNTVDFWSMNQICCRAWKGLFRYGWAST